MQKKTIVFGISYIFIIHPMDLDFLKSMTNDIEGISVTDFISSEPPEFDSQVRVSAFGSFLKLGQEEDSLKEQKKIRKIPKKEKKKKYKKRPFVCKGIYCTRSFSGFYKLKKHMEKEHPEFLSLIESYYKNLRPYKCSKCTWAFNTSSHLKSHEQRTHLDVRSFNCAYCNKAYKHPSTRNKHEKKCKG